MSSALCGLLRLPHAALLLLQGALAAVEAPPPKARRVNDKNEGVQFQMCQGGVCSESRTRDFFILFYGGLLEFEVI